MKDTQTEFNGTVVDTIESVNKVLKLLSTEVERLRDAMLIVNSALKTQNEINRTLGEMNEELEKRIKEIESHA